MFLRHLQVLALSPGLTDWTWVVLTGVNIAAGPVHFRQSHWLAEPVDPWLACFANAIPSEEVPKKIKAGQAKQLQIHHELRTKRL